MVVFPSWLVIGAVLTVVAVVAFLRQTRRGLRDTALSNPRPWGTYVSGFTFFTGLAGGCLALGGTALVLDLDVPHRFVALAALLSLAAVVAAGVLILADLGRPERAWRMLRHGRRRSPMVWDMYLLVTYTVLGAAVIVAVGAEAPWAVLAALGGAAVLAGLADGVAALVFSRLAARPPWRSALQPVSFAFAAVASGAWVILLVLLMLDASGEVDTGAAHVGQLAVVGGVGTLVGLVLRGLHGSDVQGSWFGLHAVEDGAAVGALVAMLVGLTNDAHGWFVAAALLGVLSLAVKKIDFVDSGFRSPGLPYAASGTLARRQARHGSAVTITEGALSIGVVGLFVLIGALGMALLPLGL